MVETPRSRTGLLDMMGQGDSAFAGWLDPRRNFLQQTFAGMVGHDSTKDALRGATQGAVQGRQIDTAYQTKVAKEQKAQDRLNSTVEWMRQNAPQYAGMVEAGMPVGEAWSAAMQEMQPQGSDASFSQTPVFFEDPEGNQHIGQMSSSGGVLLNGEVMNSIPEGWKITNRPQGTQFLNLGDRYAVGDPNRRGADAINPAGPAIQGSPSSDMNVQGTGPERTMQPAPGSDPAYERQQDARERADQERAQALKSQREDDRSQLVLHAIDTALDRSGFFTTGPLGSVGRAVGATPNIELESAVRTVKANLGFDQLQQMRDASPTGGALGQVSERELDFLQSTVTALDERQSEQQLDQNLEIVRTLLKRNQVYRQLDREGIPLDDPRAQQMLNQFPLPGNVDLPEPPGAQGSGQGGSDPLGIRY